MSHYYITKNTSIKGSTKVIYLPKEWGIKPGTAVSILFWKAGEEIPDEPYKLSLIVRDMNNNGAIGVYIPKAYTGGVTDNDSVSMCIITEGTDGDA